MNQKTKLYHTASLLAIFTIVFNILEGLVSVFMGIKDETLTLFGFGADSFIEVLSGIGILHMLIRIRNNHDETKDEFENRALKITGFSFYILSAGLTLTIVYNLFTGQKPETTLWGVIISLVSMLVMWILMREKLKVGRALNSPSIVADANCSKVCLYMSGVLLISSAAYELTHIAYVDLVGTAGIIWFSVNEGRECFENVRNKTVCGCGHEKCKD
jgi:divalent metal cation (Fe/Co/Zn/Cd) transporter